MNFPFLNKEKSLKNNHLQDQLSSLSNQMDELMDENVRLYMEKGIVDTGGSDLVAGQFGTVDEMYDKASLQKLFMTETWFYIAVNTIAKTIASLPYKLEKRKLIKQSVTHSNGEKEEVWKETWIEATGEPESGVFNFPNKIQSRMEFWYLVVADLLATGEAFIHPLRDEVLEANSAEDRLREAIQRVRKTDIKALYRINSSITETLPSEEEDEIIGGYHILTDEASVFFNPDEMIHIKMPNPSNPLVGLAPIIAVMKKVLLDRYTDEHHIRFYKQGARLGGAIETTKKLTKEQMSRLTKTFENNFTGKRQHHKTLILPEGMKYNIIEQSPVDSSLIEFSKTNKEPILSAYNVPPIKVSLLDGATYNNAMIQNKTYYVDTIMPLTTLIEQAINMCETILKSSRNIRFRFDFSQIEALQEDFMSKSTAAKGMADGGMTINEVREKVWGLPPLEGGNVTPALTVSSPFGGFGELSAKPEDIKVDTANAQNDTDALSDIVPTEATFESRVAQLINQAVTDGLDVGTATGRAIQQAMEEGFYPSSKENKEASHIHIDSKGISTGPAVNTGPEGLHFHILYNEEGKEVGKTSSDKEEARHTHSDGTGTISGPRSEKYSPAPFSKEALTSYSKQVVGEGVSSMLSDRRKEYEAFMDRLKSFMIKKIRKKAFKSGNSFKIKADLPSASDLKVFINEESEKISESILKASQHGYKANIPSRSIVFPNEDAKAILKKIATRNVTSVAKSSLKQLKNIITSSAADQVSVGELASRIEDAFQGIKRSRAETIARTETLQAVSVGQDLKTRDFKSKFPKEAGKLKRAWVTAQDEKVRDSHADLDGEVVEVGKKFANGLEFPRQPGGEAKEVINCRCTFIDYLPEDQDEILSILDNGSTLAE